MNYNNLSKLNALLEHLVEDGAAAGMNVAVITENEKWVKSFGN